MDIGIFFLRPWLGGGSTTFTAHLFKAIQLAGHKPMIYRIGHRIGIEETFGQFDGVRVKTIDFFAARKLVKSQPTVMTAIADQSFTGRTDVVKQLMTYGMRVVMHDPNEFAAYEVSNSKTVRIVPKIPTRVICVRHTMQTYFKDAVWIPQPYARGDRFSSVQRQLKAISTARVTASKRPEIIIEANKLLPLNYQIRLLGLEHRPYTKELEKTYKKIYMRATTAVGFPFTFHDPLTRCAQAFYNVDMSYIPDDGGGTQYSQLEAMDTGTINVMHHDWFRFDGEMKEGVHALSIDSPESLAALLKTDDPLKHQDIQTACSALLEQHDAKTVGQQYVAELGRA